MGSQIFQDVQIPLLWGTRAVVQDREGRLSVIDLSGPTARPEIIGDQPAPGIAFVPTVDGFRIKHDGTDLYTYNPRDKILTGLALRLPECQISATETRIGRGRFSGNTFFAAGVGIAVSESGLSIGASLPPGLAELIV
jgi:hypothetical protein